MKYIILYKNEFIVLLNNHEVFIPIEDRTVSKVSEPNRKELIEKLINLPQFDYDEDILLVKCKMADLDIVKIENILELIPLTEKALLAYRRKFNKGLIFTHTMVNNYDNIYHDYRKERTRIETKKSVALYTRYFLKKDKIIEDDLLNKLIDAKIEKVFNGKKDIDIKAGEYDYFFQSLSIYEDGSHLNRTYPIGYTMHAIAAMFYHLGNEINKNDLRKVSPVLREIILDEQNNSFLSLEGASSYIDNLSESNINFKKALNSFKNCDNTNFHISNLLKTTMYTLYFRYLLDVEKISFLDLNEVFKSLEINPLSNEIEMALILNVIYFPFTKIADDILRLNDNISIFVDENNYDTLDTKTELISRFLTNRHQNKVINELKVYEERVKIFKDNGYTIELLDKKFIKNKKFEIISETITNPKTKMFETWSLIKNNDEKPDLFSQTPITKNDNLIFDTSSDWKKKMTKDMKKIIIEKKLTSPEEIPNECFEKIKRNYIVYLRKVHYNAKNNLTIKVAKQLMIEIYQNNF
jgi:hypothetical protein